MNFRKADISDLLLYFDWANDNQVQIQSYRAIQFNFNEHKKWFESKVEDKNCLMLVFQNDKEINIGQVRIQKSNDKEAIIGISIASEHRGKGYAKEMLQIATDYFLDINSDFVMNAFIKENNIKSKCAFEKAGFVFNCMVNYENCQSFHYLKKLSR